jgi:hypothetical protein
MNIDVNLDVTCNCCDRVVGEYLNGTVFIHDRSASFCEECGAVVCNEDLIYYKDNGRIRHICTECMDVM